MNGYERIKAALDVKQPDHKPLMKLNFMMASNEAGYTSEEFRNDASKIAHSSIQSVKKYNFDGILINMDIITLTRAAGVPVNFPVNKPARSFK